MPAGPEPSQGICLFFYTHYSFFMILNGIYLVGGSVSQLLQYLITGRKFDRLLKAQRKSIACEAFFKVSIKWGPFYGLRYRTNTYMTYIFFNPVKRIKKLKQLKQRRSLSRRERFFYRKLCGLVDRFKDFDLYAHATWLDITLCFAPYIFLAGFIVVGVLTIGIGHTYCGIQSY